MLPNTNMKRMTYLIGIVLLLVSTNYFQAVRGSENTYNCVVGDLQKEQFLSQDPPENKSFIEIYGGWALHILLVAWNGSEELPWEYWINSSCLFRKPNDHNNWRFNQYDNGTGIILNMHSVLFLYTVGTFTVEANAGDARATAQGTFFRCGRFLEWWFVKNYNISSLN